MALELRNRLEDGLDVTLSTTLVWSYPTVSALIVHLAEKLNIVLDENSSDNTPTEESFSEEESLRAIEFLMETKRLQEILTSNIENIDIDTDTNAD
jgi:acyl carrier protein